MQTRYFDLRDTKGQQKEIEDKIGAAAKILRDGGLVGIPTETVYGLGANALDGTAVKRIFEAKGRPQDNPLIIHVTGAQWLPRYCADVPPLAYVLARKFWPGPLTMILKRRPIIPDETTAGLDTVAVRCPNHPVTLAIIREAGIPIAAPSANLSGRPSCTTAQDVLEDMDGRISGVVDGGPCAVGVESTILDLTCDPPRLLRPGGLPLEDLERLIGKIDVDKAVNGALAEGEKLGGEPMVFLHYPPVYDNMECGGILDILEERRISHCYFGHIHGQYAARKALVGEYRGVRMHLVSCDFVNFTPVLVAKG